MGQGNRRQLFVHMLKTMLKGRGIHVNKLQLEKFLLFIEEICPWFPEGNQPEGVRGVGG